MCNRCLDTGYVYATIKNYDCCDCDKGLEIKHNHENALEEVKMFTQLCERVAFLANEDNTIQKGR